MPQGVIVQDLRVLSLPAQAGRAVRYPIENIACCEGRLFGLYVRIAAGRAGRGEDLEPTAAGWGHLHLRIYARRGTNDPLRLREPVAQGLGALSFSDGRRLTFHVRRTCNALLRYRLPRCRRLRASRTA
jgi:hypothetical protein